MKLKYKIGWVLSRYWNRLLFRIMRICRAMIWDYTERNGDYLDELWSNTAEEILCDKKWIRD